jgi:serine protease inhibitor
LILSDGIKKSEYIERIKSICNVDKLEGNIEKINDFIEKYTNGLIQNLLDADRLNALIRDINMILINVIYFKSNWLHKFDKSMTSNDLFDGMKEKRVVKMMEQTNKFNYVISIDYKLVEMDYDDGLYTMGLVLPNEQTNQTNLQISYPQLVDLINRVGPNKVHLKLPKFTMKVKTDLNNMLKSIGLSDIYEDLNVPQIVDQKQCVSEAEQKIVIKVDEDGTELAVATSMMMLKCLPKKEEIVDFICNRPFLFYIRNKLNNAIVCLGRYA